MKSCSFLILLSFLKTLHDVSSVLCSLRSTLMNLYWTLFGMTDADITITDPHEILASSSDSFYWNEGKYKMTEAISIRIQNKSHRVRAYV